jgi:RHS repeat-associated protein
MFCFAEETSVGVVDQPFGFAGGIRDSATGLTRFGARDYDPGLGRWTAPDPLLFQAGETSLNNYVGADPIQRRDPTGLVGLSETSWGQPIGDDGIAVSPTGDRETDGKVALFLASELAAWVVGAGALKLAGRALRALGNWRSLRHASKGADSLVDVTRWGRPGLKAGDWVMKGKNTWSNCIRSGKFEPRWWKGGNRPAPKASGQTFQVPGSSLAKPDEHWLLNGVKSLLGQRKYKP